MHPTRTLALGLASYLAATASAAVDVDLVAPLALPAAPAANFALDPASLALPLAIDDAVAAPPAGAPSASTLPPPTASKQEEGDAELAKKLNNPVADLISVPFQFNYDEGFGPKNAGRILLNIQPVVPIGITEDWNLIIRTILPVIYEGSPANGVSSDFGLGDTTQSFFLSPKDPVDGWILGFGPAFLWPTATEYDLGSGKVGAGPTLVALRQEAGWTYGILANHIWSFAGPESRPSVNSTYLQPFVGYTFPTATTLMLNTESTYDWEDSQWSVPLNLMVSQVMRLGRLPVSIQLGGRYWAETPDGGPEWGLRFNFTFLFPK